MMREVLLVTSREFAERVRTRAFVIGTALLPLLVLGVLALPGRQSGPTERRLAVIDEAPPPLGDAFVTALNRSFIPALDTLPASRGRPPVRYEIQRLRQPLAELRADLARRLASRQIDAWVWLPPDLRESARVRLGTRSEASPGLSQDVHSAANDAVQADRLARSGLELGDIAALLQPVALETAAGEHRVARPAPPQRVFFIAYIVAMLNYMMIAMYGTGVTRSVLEEKNNRIAEVLVSSVRATHLLAGKILGVGSAVLLQVLIWIALFALAISQSHWLAARLGMSPAAFDALLAAPGVTACLLGYFILGFLLFAALFAGLGAAVTSDQEAQAYQMLFMVPLFVPLIFLFQLTTRPHEPLARLLSILPFTSPVAMPMRVASARVPTADLLLSLAALIVALFATAWVAGRIYRFGILATGRKPTLRELLHWLRSG